MKNRSKQKPPALFGLGFDNTDGHKRITRADNFVIAGGSAETHERMTETILKTEEALKRKGRDLHTADPAEIAELIDKNKR